MIVIGCDPGKSTALAIAQNGKIVELINTDFWGAIDIFNAYPNATVVIELPDTKHVWHKARNEKTRSILLRKQKEEHKNTVLDCISKWVKATENYILKRDNLVSLFVLLDSRLKPQRSDLEFMEFLGNRQIPFARVFTKSDKLTRNALSNSIDHYNSVMLEKWETLPVSFITSTIKCEGRDELLNYIEDSINNL